jgi:TusA-related sulfurtransferase
LGAKPDSTLDVRGFYCPIPLSRAKEEIAKLTPGQVLEVIADDPAAEEDIPRWVRRAGHKILKFDKRGYELRFLIRK